MSRRIPPPADPLELELVGPELYCWGCLEYWPKDEEFFCCRPDGTFYSPCRACQEESRRKFEYAPCCVPGCTEPRLSWRNARCKQHAHELYQERKRRAQVSA
jgi:hypothetical protein